MTPSAPWPVANAQGESSDASGNATDTLRAAPALRRTAANLWKGHPDRSWGHLCAGQFVAIACRDATFARWVGACTCRAIAYTAEQRANRLRTFANGLGASASGSRERSVRRRVRTADLEVRTVRHGAVPDPCEVVAASSAGMSCKLGDVAFRPRDCPVAIEISSTVARLVRTGCRERSSRPRKRRTVLWGGQWCPPQRTVDRIS
jgi:hypothetical protein